MFICFKSYLAMDVFIIHMHVTLFYLPLGGQAGKFMLSSVQMGSRQF